MWQLWCHLDARRSYVSLSNGIALPQPIRDSEVAARLRNKRVSRWKWDDYVELIDGLEAAFMRITAEQRGT